jgi:hypothetical protein
MKAVHRLPYHLLSSSRSSKCATKPRRARHAAPVRSSPPSELWESCQAKSFGRFVHICMMSRFVRRFVLARYPLRGSAGRHALTTVAHMTTTLFA